MKFSLFSLLLLCYLKSLCLASFNPPDNYLITCGSTINTTLDNRVFIGDLTKPRFLSLDSSPKSSRISLSNNPSKTSLPIYNTVRVFLGGSTTYEFNIKKNGIHLSYKLSSAFFSVSVNGYSLFDGFRPSMLSLREFIMRVNNGKLKIVFTPYDSEKGFGFVNAIEVILAPDNLILDYGVMSFDNYGMQEYKNLSSQILGTIHWINVGGLKLTPFNDKLWRTWIPDDDYLVLHTAAKRISTNHAPNYKLSGASREIAPDSAYMTAQEMNKDNMSTHADFTCPAYHRCSTTK